MPAADRDQITNLLQRVKTIAIVGLSDNPMRPSYEVAKYLQEQGYRIIPVNPAVREVLGEKAYATLAEVPEKIDLVDIFRNSESVPPIVDEAIRLKIPAVWMQETVVHPEAAEKAHHAGLMVVMDRCVKKEHRLRK